MLVTPQSAPAGAARCAPGDVAALERRSVGAPPRPGRADWRKIVTRC